MSFSPIQLMNWKVVCFYLIHRSNKKTKNKQKKNPQNKKQQKQKTQQKLYFENGQVHEVDWKRVKNKQNTSESLENKCSTPIKK